ncbi:amidase [Roseovarius sp. D22-M7]|uniref:amidase n=1 Tax=Roseovarius sp. D22-M7 TaxID=3127116 RepID=UPI0030101D26
MGDPVDLLTLDACTLRDRLANGAIGALELVEASIARIEAREPEVQAWAWFDADFARQQARALDSHRQAGRAIGPLHGLPVALKDIIDTAQIPTENGCALDRGRVPIRDAAVVDRLKAAGAIIMGKTVTTELAFMQAGATRNPHNAGHSPGGSSSGSAAAVADGMVPLAVGTQTGGSVIRPASYCGVTGYKPSFGAIPRTGVLMQSPTLDTLGVFARTPADAALLAQVLYGHDADDAATAPRPTPKLLEIATSKPPIKPVFAFVKPPGWDDADPQLHAAFDELYEALGDQVFEVPLPAAFAEAAEIRERINLAEMARYYYRYSKQIETLGPRTREALEKGNAVLARDYLAALDWPKVLYAGLTELFDRCDAVLCPAATGPAPEGLDFTGDSIFNGLWTLTGVPTVTIPAFTAENGLPMGVQMVAARENDARLLRNAHWLRSWLIGAET